MHNIYMYTPCILVRAVPVAGRVLAAAPQGGTVPVPGLPAHLSGRGPRPGHLPTHLQRILGQTSQVHSTLNSKQFAKLSER